MHPGPPVLAHGPPFSQTGLVRFVEELGEGLVEELGEGLVEPLNCRCRCRMACSPARRTKRRQ